MTEADWKILEPLEYKKALERMGGMEHLYLKLVDNYLSDYSDFPSLLNGYIHEKNDQAYVITHSLKNIAASLGAVSLAETAELMEDFFRNGDFEGNDLYLENLLEEQEKLLNQLKKLPRNENVEENAPDSLEKILAECRQALSHFSPGEIKKCRESMSKMELPDPQKSMIEKLINALKQYKYKESEEILNNLESTL